MANPRPIPPKEYQFKPGQSGNPKGRTKGSEWSFTAKCNAYLRRKGIFGDRLSDLSKKIVDEALAGDWRAAQLLLDRIDPATHRVEATVENTTPEELTTIEERLRKIIAQASGGAAARRPNRKRANGRPSSSGA